MAHADKKTEEIQARMTAFRRFGEAFNYPDEELVSRLADGSFLRDLSGALGAAGVTFDSGPLQAHFEKGGVQALLLELEKDYTWMCFASKPRQVYLFESVYREGKLMQESTFQIARLYAEAGLKLSEEFKLPPDHIAVELEFMAYLCFNEAEAVRTGNRANEELARKLQRDALSQHVQPFGIAFSERMAAHAKTDFYRTMARLLGSFLRACSV